MLTPSERVDIIKEIAARLSKEEWDLIDLTLGQFSFPTASSWSGDAKGYILAMISDAQDEALVQLADHLGYDTEGDRPGVDPDFWALGQFRLFVSHLAKDKDYATELQSQLQRYGISAFVAHKDITPTKEWEDEIKLALKTADALVALLTPDFHESDWTDQEVGFVMGRGLLAVAVRLGQEPYGFIGSLQAFQGKDKAPAVLAHEMAEVLIKNKQTSKRMGQAIVLCFEQSGSFEQAKTNMEILEKSDYWEPQFEERIKKAIKENSQVKHSWGVPELARALIQKWVPAKGHDAPEIEDIPFE